jgi:hypothetical protein
VTGAEEASIPPAFIGNAKPRKLHAFGVLHEKGSLTDKAVENAKN